ncbi:MAG: hypothetical protein ACM3U2_11030 [Deltaproteobacteria bacterium]
MESTYHGHGVRFRYPDEWQVSEQQEGDQISITVSSPQTAFWTVSLFPGCPEPEDIVAAALDAFHEEYDELDDYPSKVRVCKRRTVGRDIDFVCLELLNSAGIRAFRARQFTVLVLFQLTEAEREATAPILDRITKSLSCPATAPDEETDED